MCGGWGGGEIGALGREREEGAEASCEEGDRLRDPVPDAICGAVAPALPVDAVSMATGGGRAGPEPRSRGSASPALAPNPRLGSPACDTASSFPSLWSPNHWDPGPARGSSSSWGSGGAAMAGGPPGAATAAWLGRGAVAGAPCCCPRRDSGLGEAAVSAPLPPPLLQLRPSSCRSPRVSSSSSPSSSSGPHRLRSSSHSRHRRGGCLATPKPVITQVKMACFGRVLLSTRQPPDGCGGPRLGDVPNPPESSSHVGRNQSTGCAGRSSP